MTRTFDDRPLPDGVLHDLLDTARRAPTAGFAQGVHFLALESDPLARWWELTVEPAWRDRIAAGIGRAAAVVVPLADPQAYTERYAQPDKIAAGLDRQGSWRVPVWLTDAAMATQNLLLLAEASGIGALYYALGAEAGVLAEFGVPGHVVALGAVALGYRAPGEQPSGSPRRIARRDAPEVIHRGRW